MRLRRHLVLLIGCLFGTASSAEPAGAADACDPPDQPVGWIVSVQGHVEVRPNPSAVSRPARLEETLCSRASIRVGDRSRARVALANAPVSIDQNSTLHLVGGPELVRAAEAEPALIRLIQGALYVFSREPRALTISTPFVDAGIEGTEFLIRVEADQTEVTVFEGVVAARNAHGQLQVASGQSVVAEAGKAPVPVVVVRPRDAVAWALHYPPVLTTLADPAAAAPADLPEAVRQALLLAGHDELAPAFARMDRVPEAERRASFHLYRAALLLSVGRVDEARTDIDRAVLQDPAAGLAHALRAVIAVAQNDRTQALADARRGVELSPRQAAPKIALSYAEQARFELEAARDALLAAVKDEPKNALAWARLAELWLMLGYRDRAREAAETAAGLAPQLERTQTVLGFAALAEFHTRAAKSAFARAIALNSADPLPRFGLGLAKIRQGDLEDGRQDIEIAVGLDPGSALLRSYLGKAYFEERREALAGEQFAIAKDLDPLDPTPYFYDAIRKQSENRPVEALRDAETAIRLNENRAVYRSRELLDQDRAARGASLGRIYSDLGFQQLGINEATKALTFDPASASAHRFLSDIYATQPRREIARVSELLQAQLLQDININPVQPSLSETNLNIFARGGTARPGFNEFTPLFERNQVQLNLSGEAGSNDTFANEAVVSGLYNRFSASAGQFHYETDGFRENFDIEHDLFNVFAQAAVTPKLNVQAEFLQRSSEQGDRRLLFDPEVFSRLRGDVDAMTARAGIRLSPSPQSDILASLIYNNLDSNVSLGRIFTSHQDAIQGEARYLFRSKRINFTTGFSLSKIDQKTQIEIVGGDVIRDINSKGRKNTGYIYSDVSWPKTITWTIGFSVDDYEDRGYTTSKLNPKLGLQWQINDDLGIRFAVFQSLKPALINNRTIEPTQIAGFSQFLDDPPGTVSWSYGAGLDARLMDNLYGGVEFTRRNLEAPLFGFRNQFFETARTERDEDLYRAYLFWTPGPEWAVSSEVQLDFFKGEFIGFRPTQVETISVPLGLSYFHPSGFLVALGVTYVHQHVEESPFLFEGDEEFAIVDASVGYRFPRRRGLVSLEVRNLFDTDFRYRDDSFARGQNEYIEQPNLSTPFIPDRTVLARLTLNF